jgi:hypothetical protein
MCYFMLFGVRKRMGKTEAFILEPTKEGQRKYVWEGLEVRKTKHGNGVFASKNLKKGLMIPILGLPLYKQPVKPADTHHWEYQNNSLKGVHIDGRPKAKPFHSYQGVGSFGLAVAMMLDESTRPNCFFKFNYLVVGRTVKAGGQLTTWYGDSYQEIRQREGYKLDADKAQKNTDKFEHWDKDKWVFPKAVERFEALIYWLNIIEEEGRKVDGATVEV